MDNQVPPSSTSAWEVEFYADSHGREPCREWAEGLSPPKRAAFTTGIRLVLARRGLDVMQTEYGKALGEGLYEFRICWSAGEIANKLGDLPLDDIGGAPEEILLRIFFCTAGRKIILLLSGYDKGKQSNARWQQLEINRARKHLASYREQRRRGPRVP
jgi:hypothetical protein